MATRLDAAADVARLDAKLHGADLLGDPGAFDAKWMDTFMGQIRGREYEGARETLRRAVACGVSDTIARQYASVLEDFLRQVDEASNPSPVEAQYGCCAVRVNADSTGKGLFVPGFCSWGEVLWKEQPLAYIQSPCSRKAVKVCCACLTPVGTLATQLLHMGLPVPPGAEEVLLNTPSSGSTEKPQESAEPIPCPRGCSEVFCSQECCDWAWEYSSHALLCSATLPPQRSKALEAIEELADEFDQEHILLLAHHVAVMLLHRKRGLSLEAVLQRYAHQFVTTPWDTLVDEEKDVPEPHDRAANARKDTAATRRKLLHRTTALLHALFATEELVEPLLDPELLRSIIGSFELINMCISLPHPLNREDIRGHLRKLLDTDSLRSLLAIQLKADDDDDDNEDEDTEAEVPSMESALEALEECSLFANVLGSAQCEALALTNHSCLPNCDVDFAPFRNPLGGVCAGDGPGLWLYSLAKRPLLPGDEVLMAYLPSVVGQPLEIRRQRLLKFGFTCQCRCCLTDEKLASEGVVIPPRPSSGG